VPYSQDIKLKNANIFTEITPRQLIDRSCHLIELLDGPAEQRANIN